MVCKWLECVRVYPEIAKLFREQLSTNTSYPSTQDEHFSDQTFHVIVTVSQLRISCCLLQSPQKTDLLWVFQIFSNQMLRTRFYSCNCWIDQRAVKILKLHLNLALNLLPIFVFFYSCLWKLILSSFYSWDEPLMFWFCIDPVCLSFVSKMQKGYRNPLIIQ